MQHDDTPRDPADQIRRRLADFPGPVALADRPDGDWRALWGAESTDGGPHKAHVRYVRETPGARELALSIHTVRPDPVPAPVIGTVESLLTVLLELRRTTGRREPDDVAAAAREEAAAPERPWVVLVDDVEFTGRRKDFPDVSVLEIRWHDGMRILCGGAAEVVDGLRLRAVPGIPADGLG
ncbi:MAG TPA: hypothetical protein VL551_27295 [Actinospica sp.]|jgi:hypothetical protein|nr:hypothetical protein [Actinospica sp.]